MECVCVCVHVLFYFFHLRLQVSSSLGCYSVWIVLGMLVWLWWSQTCTLTALLMAAWGWFMFDTWHRTWAAKIPSHPRRNPAGTKKSLTALGQSTKMESFWERLVAEGRKYRHLYKSSMNDNLMDIAVNAEKDEVICVPSTIMWHLQAEIINQPSACQSFLFSDAWQINSTAKIQAWI